MKILFICQFAPYDKVGHAGGKTVNYYIKKFSECEDVSLVTFVSRDDYEKLDYEKYNINAVLIKYKYKFVNKLMRKICVINMKKNPFAKYNGLYFAYDLNLLKHSLKKLHRLKYKPDIIIMEWSQTLFVMEEIKKIFPDSKYIASEHDLYLKGYSRKIKTSNLSRKKVQKKINIVKDIELNGLQSSDLVVFHSKADLESAKQMIPECKHLSSIVPFFDDYKIINWKRTTYNIIFFGAMGREENYKSAIWFYYNVFKKLDTDKFKFVLIGSKPNECLIDIAKKDSSVIVTGFVEDVTPLFENCFCAVAPLLYGSGIKVKVLETFSAGIPLLTNNIGIEGIDANDGLEYIHCNDVDDYISAIKLLESTPEFGMSLSENSRKFLEKNFDLEKSFQKYYDKMKKILEEKNE